MCGYNWILPAWLLLQVFLNDTWVSTRYGIGNAIIVCDNFLNRLIVCSWLLWGQHLGAYYELCMFKRQSRWTLTTPRGGGIEFTPKRGWECLLPPERARYCLRFHLKFKISFVDHLRLDALLPLGTSHNDVSCHHLSQLYQHSTPLSKLLFAKCVDTTGYFLLDFSFKYS